MLVANPSQLSMSPETRVTSHEWVNESYRRCQAMDLDRGLKRLEGNPGLGQSNEFLTRPTATTAYSLLLFADIYRDLSDRNYVFLLTDHTARVISIYSCAEILEDLAGRIGLSTGVSFGEEVAGTNAIALALRHREAVVVRGEEHYCRVFYRWCAVAVPVVDGNRRLIACVSVSNCHDVTVGEKLALAKFIAKDLSEFHKTTTVSVSSVENASTHDQVRVDITPRQQQVLQLFAKGQSYKQIARQLGISSTKTVEEHLDAVRVKLKVPSRRACIMKAMQRGMLTDLGMA